MKVGMGGDGTEGYGERGRQGCGVGLGCGWRKERRKGLVLS